MNSLEILKSTFATRAILQGKLETFRLFDGAGDGIPGLYIDKLNELLIIHVHQGVVPAKISDEISRSGEQLAVLAKCKSIYLWRHEQKAAKTTSAGAELLYGGALPEYQVRENDLIYIIRVERTPSAGFFLDMRDVRVRLKTECGGKRVLNTFCFTGSLGLAALLGGAIEVVQVDISKSILTWARENLELNRGSLKGEMRFIEEDSLSFMNREVRRLEKGKPKYDLIIIDPPSYGSTKGRTFSLERDLEKLVKCGIELLATNGEMIITSNFSSIGPKEMEDCISKVSNRKVEHIYPPKEDFTSGSNETNSMKGIWLKT